MDELDTFVAEIIESKNLPGLNDEVRLTLIEDLKDQLLDQVDRALLEELNDEQLDVFVEKMEQTDGEGAAQEFLLAQGVDIERVTARTMLTFRDLYLRSPEERSKE
jgi:hypothetical protein